jgi:hypothetical protein
MTVDNKIISDIAQPLTDNDREIPSNKSYVLRAKYVLIVKGAMELDSAMA